MGRVVQVTARVIWGRAASNCWQMVVLPPPDGAEIRTSKGLAVGRVLLWLSPLASRPSTVIFDSWVATLFLVCGDIITCQRTLGYPGSAGILPASSCGHESPAGCQRSQGNQGSSA